MKLYDKEKRFLSLLAFSTFIIEVTLAKPFGDGSIILSDTKQNDEIKVEQHIEPKIFGPKTRVLREVFLSVQNNTEPTEPPFQNLQPQGNLTTDINKIKKPDTITITVYMNFDDNNYDDFPSDSSLPSPLVFFGIIFVLAVVLFLLRVCFYIIRRNDMESQTQRPGYRTLIVERYPTTQHTSTPARAQMPSSNHQTRIIIATSNQGTPNELPLPQDLDLPPSYSSVVNENENIDFTLQSPAPIQMPVK